MAVCRRRRGGTVPLAARADYVHALREPGLGHSGDQELALLARRLEERHLERRQRHGQRDAGHAGAGAQVEPVLAGRAGKRRYVEQAQRVADQGFEDLLSAVQAGEVGAPPVGEQIHVASQRFDLAPAQVEARTELFEGDHAGSLAGHPLRRRRRVPARAKRRAAW